MTGFGPFFFWRPDMAPRDYPVKNGLGEVIVDGLNGGAMVDNDDAALVETDVSTSATAGVWVELMPANAARQGASVQAVYVSGNVFFKALAAGLPAAGKQTGELQLPAAPAYFKFDFDPRKRYVMRGDAASLVVSLKTW